MPFVYIASIAIPTIKFITVIFHHTNGNNIKYTIIDNKRGYVSLFFLTALQIYSY
jgi:hypothetical protein